MKKVGFIGAGNMATAIIDGLIRTNAQYAQNITVFDVLEEKLEIMRNKGVNTTDSVVSVAEKCGIIVLAVKPQNYAQMLEEMSKAD